MVGEIPSSVQIIVPSLEFYVNGSQASTEGSIGGSISLQVKAGSGNCITLKYSTSSSLAPNTDIVQGTCPFTADSNGNVNYNFAIPSTFTDGTTYYFFAYDNNIGRYTNSVAVKVVAPTVKLYANGLTGTVSGSNGFSVTFLVEVNDPYGNPIPNVAVLLDNLTTQTLRNGTTNSNGDCSFSPITFNCLFGCNQQFQASIIVGADNTLINSNIVTIKT